MCPASRTYPSSPFGLRRDTCGVPPHTASRRRSRWSLLTRRAVSAHAVSPALVFPPGPPFPRRPLSQRKSTRGDNPSRLRRHFVGGTQHGSPCFMCRRPAPCPRSGCRRIRRPRIAFTAWVAATTSPLHQSPQPPRESGHTGRTACSFLSGRLPALGGKVPPSLKLRRASGPQPARCTSHGRGLSAVSGLAAEPSFI